MRLLPVASVSQDMRTTPCGTSCGLTCRTQRTTPRPILGWSSSSSSFRVSSRKLTLFQLFRMLRRTAIHTDFPCQFVWNQIRIRFSPNRRASSRTRSPCGLSCHSTIISRWISLASFHRVDSPCFRRVRNCCRHHFGAFFLGPVGRLHCALTRLDRHDHGAYLPLCTTSCSRHACFSTHTRSSPL